jgi:L-2-hydroxyglutarate oxidase LhgO
VLVCAGLQSDRLARLSGGARDPRIVPFRGDYYILRPERRQLVNALVYPVPDPQFPFLGIHSTLRPDGEMWLGPNALLAVGRESYGRWNVVPRDLVEALAAPGFRRLARQHWRLGLLEAARGYSTRLFVEAARRLFPDLGVDDVVRGPSGIRAQALAPDGSLVDDFVFDHHQGVLHVRNAPSPGATSSLAIADEIVDRAVEAFGL